MPVDIDIAKVAALARLALDPEELARYGTELGDILDHAVVVQSLPTEGVPPTSHPLPMENAFRPDTLRDGAGVDRDDVLSQAPAAEDGYFRVPRILEEE
jgi:aspartyl-tRNA(Asn)/glutamyl-tRNA(Gln) amidotransferase subunit C